MNPVRVRQSRQRGASIGDAVSVAAPSRWANPYRHVRPRSIAVVLYRDLYLPNRPDLDPRELRGRDLACYCPPDQPCHADVLLDLANREDPHMTALRRRGRTRPGPWLPPFQPASDGWLLALVAAGLLLHLLVTR